MRDVYGGMPLTLRVLDGSTVVLVRAGGVADLATAPLLRAVLSDLLDEGRSVVLDVSGLSLIDAHTVGVLTAVHRSASDLRLVGAAGLVRQVLEICEAGHLLDTPTAAELAAGSPIGAAEDRTVETLLRTRAGHPGEAALGDVLRRLAIAHGHALAIGLARRYHGRGEPDDDLQQVAVLGLIKAVDGFDPQRGTAFNSYAVPTILGELRRHFRDRGWQIRVPRRMQELRMELAPASERLSQRLGRAPTTAELAAELDVSEDDVIETHAATEVYRVRSLFHPVGSNDSDSTLLADLIGEDDPRLDLVDFRESLRPLLAALPDRERRILELRFYHDRTQSEIAEAIGISQMHVSRLLAGVLRRLRRDLLGENLPDPGVSISRSG